MPIVALNRRRLHLGVTQVAAHSDNAAVGFPLTKSVEPSWLHNNQFDTKLQVDV